MWVKNNHFFSPFFIFFFLLLILFVVYFIRPEIPGYDSYGFMLLSCRQDNSAGITGIPFMFFSWLPCDLLVFKTIVFLCTLLSGFFCLKFAFLFSKKSSFASLLIFLSPYTIFGFAALENDTIAYPFLFAAVFFFFYFLKNKTLNGLISLFISLLLLIVAAFFWEGAIFYLIAFSLNLWWLLFFSIPTTFFFWEKLIGNIFRSGLVEEDAMFSFHYHMLLSIGIVGVLFEPLLLPQGLWFFLLGMAAGKFWVLSLPFLLSGFCILVEKANSDALKISLVVLAFFCLFGLAISVYNAPPTKQDWNAIDFALSLDKNVSNDWDLGYWVKWKGGQTESYQSPWRQKQFAGITITKQKQNCELLKQFNNVFVYDC